MGKGIHRGLLGGILLSLLAWGCGYHLLGRGGAMPPGVRTVGVPTVQNRTGRSEIEQRITEALIEELTLRAKLSVRGDDRGVDVLLEGEILSYGVQPVAINAEGRATRYEITIRARVLLQDLRNDLQLWEDQHFVFKKQYDVDPDLQTFVDLEILAIDQVARDFAETVVTSLLEGF